MILFFLIALAIVGVIIFIIYLLAWHDEYKEYLKDISSLEDNNKVKIIYNLKSKMIKSIIKVSNKWKFDYIVYTKYNYYVESTRYFQLAYLEDTDNFVIIKIPFLLYIKMVKAKNKQNNADKMRIFQHKENENTQYLISKLQEDINALKRQADEEISSACDTVKEVTERLNKE